MQQRAWYVWGDGRQFGPYDLEAFRKLLREKRIAPSQLVRPADSERWSEMRSLRSILLPEEQVLLSDGFASEAALERRGGLPAHAIAALIAAILLLLLLLLFLLLFTLKNGGGAGSSDALGRNGDGSDAVTSRDEADATAQAPSGVPGPGDARSQGDSSESNPAQTEEQASNSLPELEMQEVDLTISTLTPTPTPPTPPVVPVEIPLPEAPTAPRGGGGGGNSDEVVEGRMAREGAQSGDVQITLIWNNYNDLDLHVECPNGHFINYMETQCGCGGHLDVDMNAGGSTSNQPIENIFWPVGGAPSGTYKVGVHHYANRGGHDPTSFTVRIVSGGRTITKAGTITAGQQKSVHTFTR